ncbi:MAG: hypothetical protein H7Z21_10495 [Hymenobacter sp.]|nr:hypothetical protein [Hymenobacter sp.]
MAFDPAYPFELPHIPPPVALDSADLLQTLLKARTELGELKGYSSVIPLAGHYSGGGGQLGH